MQDLKVALIIQRYGEEVNGGAEAHCRQVALHLSKQYQVEILTTCAKDYRTWIPVFASGETEHEGILVRRFMNQRAASSSKLRFIRHKITGRLLKQRVAKLFGLKRVVEKLFPSLTITEADHQKWLEYQGPYCPDLLDYLQAHSGNYAAFVFFTALYYPAAVGVMRFPKKSILIPMVHNEKSNYYQVYQEVMNAPEWIFYNTNSEKIFSQKLYNNQDKKNDVLGLGVALPELKPDVKVLEKYHIMDTYILYIGRIEKGKGCKELIDYFLQFKVKEKGNLKLVMVGQAFMPLIKHDDIIYTGFLSETDKLQLLLQCQTLLIPSKYESLSMVLLEAFFYQKPVIVNNECIVLKEHILASDGGYAYSSFQDFHAYLKQCLLLEELRATKGRNGKNYVLKNYNWEIIMSKYEAAISDIQRINKY